MADDLAARQKLEKAIEKFVKDVNGPTSVPTEFIVVISSVDMHHPTSVTTYNEHAKGSMHAQMGLTEFHRQHLFHLNAEEV